MLDGFCLEALQHLLDFYLNPRCFPLFKLAVLRQQERQHGKTGCSDCHFLLISVLALWTEVSKQPTTLWTAYFNSSPASLLPALVTASEPPDIHQTSCLLTFQGKKESGREQRCLMGSAWSSSRQTEHVLKMSQSRKMENTMAL